MFKPIISFLHFSSHCGCTFIGKSAVEFHSLSSLQHGHNGPNNVCFVTKNTRFRHCLRPIYRAIRGLHSFGLRHSFAFHLRSDPKYTKSRSVSKTFEETAQLVSDLCTSMQEIGLLECSLMPIHITSDVIVGRKATSYKLSAS